jgi:hypothetical protein
LSRANSSAHAELVSIARLPVSAIGLRMVAAANLVEVAALMVARRRDGCCFSCGRSEAFGTKPTFTPCPRFCRYPGQSRRDAKIVDPTRMTQTLRSSELQKKRTGSTLIAVSLGNDFSDKPFASFPARTRAMSRAPVQECVRIDADSHDDVSVGLKASLHFLGNLQPLLPGARHPVAICENSHQRWVIFFVDPIDSHRWRRSVL